jgi:hypothetical protein
VVGNARVMSYKAILKAEKKREEKRAITGQARAKKTHHNEMEEAKFETESLGLKEYCSVLQF